MPSWRHALAGEVVSVRRRPADCRRGERHARDAGRRLALRRSSAAADRLTHDLAGLFVVVLAALLMAGFIWYLNRLIVEVRPLTGGELLHDWHRGSRRRA